MCTLFLQHKNQNYFWTKFNRPQLIERVFNWFRQALFLLSQTDLAKTQMINRRTTRAKFVGAVTNARAHAHIRTFVEQKFLINRL